MEDFTKLVAELLTNAKWIWHIFLGCVAVVFLIGFIYKVRLMKKLTDAPKRYKVPKVEK